jgi:CheY-like chemotaxis protein
MNNTMDKVEILLVEDEQIAAMDIRQMIEELDYRVLDIVDTSRAALEKLEQHSMDLIIMDIMLAGKDDGIKTVRKINQSYDIPVVYLTAYSDDETLTRAKETNPAGFLVKPVTKEDLRTTIEIVLENNDPENS